MSSSNSYMNQVKRQLNEDTSTSKETKKLRRTTLDNNEQENSSQLYFNHAICHSIPITRIEQLSNEVFYEIFDYLDGCDICEAFFNLNTRFNHLITRSFLPIKIYRSDSSSQISDDHYQQIIIPNRHRITSFHMHDQSQVLSFFTAYTIDSSFDRLESLVLYGILYNNLISFLPSLTTLPRFYSLDICLGDRLRNFAQLYQMIFRLPSLKYIKLSAERDFLNLLLPFNIEGFSPIERLFIDYACVSYELLSILSYTPRLRHLTCTNLRYSRSIVREIPNNISNLTHVSINTCHLRFNELEIFIQKLFSQVRVLRLKEPWDSSYLDPERWERLIKKRMPHLRILDFEYNKSLYNHHTLEPYYSLLNRFISPFWIDRHWFFELKIFISSLSPSTITYSIHPVKKHWHELYDYGADSHQIATKKSTKSPFSCLHLIVGDCQVLEYYQSFLEYVHPILTAVQITCLHIDFQQFSISILIEFLRLLPNLNSLTITSKSPEQTKILSDEQTNIIRSISIDNKITKVNLEQITELDQIHILMDLCSHMINLQVKCRNRIDVEWLIRYVLMKRNTNFIPHLCSLCLRISKANDGLIKNLQTIIDTEKLLINYTIKRISDRIYLRWE